eukprot:TRINITY_DN2179_c0_g1_i1.p1 TRINITY_DN2179_c0_g1~~TRINITY_DN2179_c0_g1_i1.p1  ORF type:complete len:1067 (-),score=472.48 TRINITY_DN2179_c0_g1_i1:84-3284(-)
MDGFSDSLFTVFEIKSNQKRTQNETKKNNNNTNNNNSQKQSQNEQDQKGKRSKINKDITDKLKSTQNLKQFNTNEATVIQIEQEEDSTINENQDENQNQNQNQDQNQIQIQIQDQNQNQQLQTEEQKKQIESELDREIILCQHDLAVPPSWSKDQITKEIMNPPIPLKMAREYPFVLDPFQKVSIACIERQESVLVSAHTSAGKTVVAQYAIALSLRDGQRVIYTSPIKALSNQKYRELSEEFKDVGLMTGDVTINPSASCLVMTTEILRSMLYRGSEIMREVAWVVFDEIHYMRDKERGVVWEETIILLPDKVRYVFLSATIPNALEFAQWIAKIHNQPCHVVYSETRPIPLNHYIFPAGGDGLHLVVDEKSNFREENFQKALGVLANKPIIADKNKKKNFDNSDIYKIIKVIIDRSYEPVIIFSFSKKDCEVYALQMAKLDLNNDDEKKMVENIFVNAIDTLSEDDKKLPQVDHILPLLKRGIGIHHSGLLPILKEVIEILFQEGLLKALFATETFSIGLNMPAKTVVFTNVRKFDGNAFRWLSSGEYIQMSGRAGRRGLDDRGIVILMIDSKMEPSIAKGMVKGQADPLLSSFHLGYNMLLNLLRVEGVSPEYLIRKSFHQFQTDKNFPTIENKLKSLVKKKNKIDINDESTVAEYYNIRSQLAKLSQQIREIMMQPINILPFIQPGRIIRVKDKDADWGWGIVINFEKKTSEKNTLVLIDVLLNCLSGETPNDPRKPCPPNQIGQVQILPISLNCVDQISSLRVYVPRDLRSSEQRQSVMKSLREVIRRFPDGIPLLDPIEDIQIEDELFGKISRKIEALEDKLKSNPKFKNPELAKLCIDYEKKNEFETEIKQLKKQLKDKDSHILKDELSSMKRVLRRLGFTNSENVIEIKGRVACEINALDELVLTEMIFNGLFNNLQLEQITALLSCFAFQEKSHEVVKLREELSGPFQLMQDTARRIGKVAEESKVKINVEEYVQSFPADMMEIVYAWTKGAKFIEICKMTEIFEGTIIRVLRRLEEGLRQLCAAAKAIGNNELETKFSEGITLIKRDIVFAASLYL